jgi:hypothetical protein
MHWVGVFERSRFYWFSSVALTVAVAPIRAIAPRAAQGVAQMNREVGDPGQAGEVKPEAA